MLTLIFSSVQDTTKNHPLLRNDIHIVPVPVLIPDPVPVLIPDPVPVLNLVQKEE